MVRGYAGPGITAERDTKVLTGFDVLTRILDFFLPQHPCEDPLVPDVELLKY